MVALPAIGSRVSLRYRVGASESTDVIGFLEAVAPALLIRTKSDGIVEVAPEAVIAVREIPYRPVRTSEIRALEHAAAMAWPGVEQQWLDGWFLRAGHGITSRANSAVPLDFSASLAPLPEIVDWYDGRGLPAWLALPERVLPVRAAGVKGTRVLVRQVDPGTSAAGGAVLSAVPDAQWLAIYRREVPVDVLAAVVDGEVVFASIPGVAVGRGAVTVAPDGHRWLGISAVSVDPAQRRQGHARRVCDALLAWGAGNGALRSYVQVLDDNDPAIGLYMSMGFQLHHSHRYVEARALMPGGR
jgi:N-acetylglutamate synthase